MTTASTRRRWLGMPFIALGVSMIIVDATIVNVAIPSIIRDLHVSTPTAEWFNAIYALVFAALLITVGRAGDIFGRRRLLILGTLVFVAASLITASAHDGSILIFGRFCQGVGGAMILPSTLSTLNALFQGRDRAIAFAIWGSTIGGVAALGPLLGGWLTTDFSWRWAFLINAPIGIAIVAGTLLFVAETRDQSTDRRVDVVGVLSSTIGLASLVFGLIEGQSYGWWSPTPGKTLSVAGLTWPWGGIAPSPIAFILAAVAIALFVRVEASRGGAGKATLIDLSLFRIRSFRNGNVAALTVALGEFGLLFTIPLYLQSVLGYSALSTGTLLLALAGGAFLVGGTTPQVARRLGGRGIVRLGLALEVIGIGGLGFTFAVDTAWWALAPWLFIYGCGVGFATAQLTSVILAEVPVEFSGQASGIQSTFRQVGSALGIAILGSILVTGIGTSLSDRLAHSQVPVAVRASIVDEVKSTAGALIPALRARAETREIAAQASAAVVEASRTVAFFAALFVFIGLLATLGLPAVERRSN
ncbi:MAG TPA: MFS transporter [Candidatus Dormibacteraeota bacterium]|nr:MFS transporter [Candidatus Dormibacteraeota bacterium]